MSSKDYQCSACQKDHGFCVYCQKQYASVANLHRHIKRLHQGSIRIEHCDDEREEDV